MKPESPPQLMVTGRLFLRAPDPNRHAAAIWAAVRDDRERLARWLPWVRGVQSEADERDFLCAAVAQWSANEAFHWIVIDRENGGFVGVCAAPAVHWRDGRAELGYWAVSAYEGTGRMREAVQAVQDALFGVGLRRLEIRCQRRNQRSAGIAARLGYQLEGELRDHSWSEDGFDDMLIFGRLRSDGNAEPQQLIDPTDAVSGR